MMLAEPAIVKIAPTCCPCYNISACEACAKSRLPKGKPRALCEASNARAVNGSLPLYAGIERHYLPVG